jgi:hypothetical protein
LRILVRARLFEYLALCTCVCVCVCVGMVGSAQGALGSCRGSKARVFVYMLYWLYISKPASYMYMLYW